MTSDPIGRVRRWWARLRAIPGRIEMLEHEMHATFRNTEIVRDGTVERLNTLRPELIEDIQSAAREVQRHQDRHLEPLSTTLAAMDGAIAEQGTITRVALESAARDDATRSLIETFGPPAPLRPGLSIFTISWNHADCLGDAVRSGLEVLDGLPESLAGEVLVLDDGSSDRTAEILGPFASRHDRVRVIRAPVNLGLSRARNVLLHTCDRQHALMLDADNLAEPTGVAGVYEVARRFGSALTYGALTWRELEGPFLRFGSAGPYTEANVERLDVDTFAVVDVGALRRRRGWTTDPALHAFDDQELVRRLAYFGELIGFVPLVAGTYHSTHEGHSRVRGDLRPRRERLQRMYRFGVGGEPAAFVAHPDAGPLWASPAAERMCPQLRPSDSGPARTGARRRFLVVAPGGVGNLGDDLITEAVVDRLRRIDPDADLDLVTDGPKLPVDLEPIAWRGTLQEVVDAAPARDDETGTRKRWIPLEPSHLDLAVFAGGGNLNSRWCADLVAGRAALLARLRIAGVPVIASGQGIGPFDSDADDATVHALLRNVGALGVRDPVSLAAVVTSVAGSSEAELVGDDALGIAVPTDDELDAVLTSIGVPPGAPLVALHVRYTDYVGLDATAATPWAEAIDDLASSRGAYVVGIALNWEPPVPEPVALLALARDRTGRAPWRILDEPSRPRLAAAVLRRACLGLVCSYHAALVAIEARVPTLYFAGAEYSRRKAEGLRQLASLPEEFVVEPGTSASELGSRLSTVERALAESAGLDEAAGAVDAWLEAKVRAMCARSPRLADASRSG